jgi:hypothetical protein
MIIPNAGLQRKRLAAIFPILEDYATPPRAT